jgi:hypothetical protein
MVKRDWIVRYSELLSVSDRLMTLQSWERPARGPRERLVGLPTWILARHKRWYLVRLATARRDKASRMAVASAKFEAGQALLPETSVVVGRPRSRALRIPRQPA